MDQKQKNVLIFSIIFILVLILAISTGVYFKDQTNNQKENNNQNVVVEKNNPIIEKIPSFNDFPISSKFEGEVADVNFSSNDYALTFKTALTQGAKKGPDFAGHYTVVSWGCGTMCQTTAIVDAETGDVYFPYIANSLGADFVINSSLFILNPMESIDSLFSPEDVPDYLKTIYYKWENNELIKLIEVNPKDYLK